MNRDAQPTAVLALLTLALGLCARLAATGATADARPAQYARWIERDEGRAARPLRRHQVVLQGRPRAAAEGLRLRRSKGQGWQHGEWSEPHAPAARAGLSGRHAAGRHRRAEGRGRPGLPRPLRAVAGGEVPDRQPTTAGSCARRSSTAARSRRRTSAKARAALLLAMAARSRPGSASAIVALRTGARLLPHGADDASAQKVRNMAAALADRDAGFQPLRIKIHGSPDAATPTAVRAWAAQRHACRRSATQALALAAEIDRVLCAACRWRRRLDAARAHAGRRCRGGCRRRWRSASSVTPPARRRAAAVRCRPSCCCSCATACRGATPAQRLAIVDLSLAVELRPLPRRRRTARAATGAGHAPRADRAAARRQRCGLRHRPDRPRASAASSTASCRA